MKIFGFEPETPAQPLTREPRGAGSSGVSALEQARDCLAAGDRAPSNDASTTQYLRGVLVLMLQAHTEDDL